MILLLYSGRKSKGRLQERAFGTHEGGIELALEHISRRVANGFWLETVELIDEDGSRISLPLEAIDGRPMLRPLRRLQAEWEFLLRKAL